jgi:ABC-type nitrate/sulfonate/bicarbonate transport system ATPase subunit
VGASVSVTGVWKKYRTVDGEISALENVSLTVADGEFVAVVGPSGCGKSTLLNLIAGFEKPDRGEILVDGRPILSPSRRGILITQRGSVFPWMTVGRNLDIALDGTPEAERRLLTAHYVELVGLAGFEDRYPHELSGGMLQRVEVARALMAKPDLLYMDEPFGALDALTRLKMRNELLRILTRDRHTCLLVTHDVEEALQLADRIYVMTPRPGRVQCVVEVTVAQPRRRISSPDLIGLKERILTELGLPPIVRA